MKAKITHRTVAALEPRERPYDVRDTELTGFIARVRPTGGISYLIQYRDAAGRQQSYTLGQHGTEGYNPTRARDDAERIRLRARTGEDPQRARRESARRARVERDATLRGYLEGDYTLRLAKRKAASAAETVKTLHRHFGEWMGWPLVDITPERVGAWRRSMERRGRSASTIRRVNADLARLVACAVEDHVINANPLDKLGAVDMAGVADEHPRYLDDAEAARLRAALVGRDERLRRREVSGRAWREARGYPVRDTLPGRFFDHLHPMVLVSLNTGVRQGELFALEWFDVATDDDRAPTELRLRGATTKNRRPRTIPLNAEARQVLADWRAQCPEAARYVFDNGGRPYTDVSAAWERLRARAELTDFRWHDLRHDFASQLVIRGVPLNTVRDLLGHKDIATTLKYAHLWPGAKVDAVRVLDR